jgi:hypothetical protein
MNSRCCRRVYRDRPVRAGERHGRKDPRPMPSYITKPSGFCWHILRPDERYLVWCQANMDGPTWTQITLNVPASVCHVCRELRL